jgi:hypothetical protein
MLMVSSSSPGNSMTGRGDGAVSSGRDVSGGTVAVGVVLSWVTLGIFIPSPSL